MPSNSLDDGRSRNGPPARDILVAGLPGGFRDWTLALLAGALRRQYSEVRYLPIGGDAGWTPQDASAARLFCGEIINDKWAVPVRDHMLPAVLIIDDVASAWAAMLQTGQSLEEAARALAAFAMAAGDLVGTGQVLTLAPADLADHVACAAAILAHACLPAAGLDDLLAQTQKPDLTQPALPDGATALTDAVVVPALCYARTGFPVPMTWPRDCLIWGDHPGQPLPRLLDMTGPARVIAYGPYYPLPRGAWTVRATLAFSPSACGTPLALELHGNTQLGRFEFEVQQPGIFAASFPILVASAHQPLEIRLRTERGAIAGTLGIDRIDLIPRIRT